LRVLYGGEELEIGAVLNNTDREWLTDRLEEWANA